MNFRKHKNIGTFMFYILWPLIWFYAPLRLRVRAVITCKDEVLVVKNWFGPNVWQLPGGGMKIGESSRETIIRELHEELALEVADTAPEVLNNSAAIVNKWGLLFRYQYLQIKFNEKPEISTSSEVTKADWIKISDLDIPQSVKASLL